MSGQLGNQLGTHVDHAPTHVQYMAYGVVGYTTTSPVARERFIFLALSFGWLDLSPISAQLRQALNHRSDRVSPISTMSQRLTQLSPAIHSRPHVLRSHNAKAACHTMMSIGGCQERYVDSPVE